MPSAKQGSSEYHFGYDSTRGMNPKSTDCEAVAPTTTPSHRFHRNVLIFWGEKLRQVFLNSAPKYLAFSGGGFKVASFEILTWQALDNFCSSDSFGQWPH